MMGSPADPRGTNDVASHQQVSHMDIVKRVLTGQ